MNVDKNDLVDILALCYGAIDDEWCGDGTPWDVKRLRMFAEKYNISEAEVLHEYHKPCLEE